jgi:hypothetical protein
MTRFLIRAAGVKPLVAIVATHGLTDLDSIAWLPHYALLSLLPIPSPLVTALFCLSSVVHFSEDVGMVGSVLIHGAVAGVGYVRGVQVALKSMLYYLSFFHVPMHYWRCYVRNRYLAAMATAAVTAVAVAFSRTMNDWVPLTDGMQRVATAHIFTEAAVLMRELGV